MHAVDVIARKRDGHALPREAIAWFVNGVTDGSIPDYQAAAWLMAVVLRGMDGPETAALTDAMLDSGERLDLRRLPGTKVGKHSTGGVGDKVSIALVPLAASCGLVVPKMSGRGLGHTGGTIDKLEAIPGYRTNLSVAEFLDVLAEVGGSIVGQSAALAPADRKLYALRDVTATVESIPLIAASIMSKKLAEGTDALVLDVKCGAGAFMKSLEEARQLADVLVAIGARAGVRTEAVITRMEAPLGRTIGNALEIAECVEILRGTAAPDVSELVVALVTHMLRVGLALDDATAEARVAAALASGAALERLRRMIACHGGDPEVVDDRNRLPRARHRLPLLAERTGCVTALEAARLGRAAVLLGAGRARVGEAIDPAAGITIEAQIGACVRPGAPLLHLHTNDAARLDEAAALAREAIRIADEPPAAMPMVMATVGRR
jgi:pyrimidine-nucleoside phosphorylase